MKNASIKRLVKYITMHLKKTIFEPNELQAIYTNIVPRIQSSLPKQNLEKILSDILYWIEQGGEVILQKKL